MSEILLSILIPSIPSRFEAAQRLVKELERQIGSLPVEVLLFMDNKKRSIGMKRDALVQMANGRFLCFCDDDDIPSPDYIDELHEAVLSHGYSVDVIVFDQLVRINDKNPFVVRFGLENENEQVKVDPLGEYMNINRKPFHVCPWRSELVKKYRFPDFNYSEDWKWVEQFVNLPLRQHRIEKILHEYVFDDAVTEAK